MISTPLLESLRLNTFFADVDAHAIQQLESHFFIKKEYLSGDIIIEENTLADAMYLLVSGKAKVTKMDGNGNLRTIVYRTDGDFIGELALLDGKKRSAGVECVEKVIALRIDKDSFFQLIEEIPQLQHNVIQAITSKLRENDEQSSDEIAKSRDIIRHKEEEINQTNSLLERVIELNQKILSQKKELEHKNKELYQMAITDQLTQVYNRIYLMNSLEKEFSKSHRHDLPLACIMIDIDHFKHFNDEYGHAVGDVVLQKTATLMAQQIRKEDIFGRLGGEEFLLILPHTDLDEAHILAEEIRRKIAETTYTINDLTTQVTISLGIADNITEKPCSETALLQHADVALYAAKHQGRNCSCTYPSGQPTNIG